MNAEVAHALAAVVAALWTEAALTSVYRRADAKGSVLHDVAVTTIKTSIQQGLSHVVQCRPQPHPPVEASPGVITDQITDDAAGQDSTTMLLTVLQAHAGTVAESVIDHTLVVVRALSPVRVGESNIEQPHAEKTVRLDLDAVSPTATVFVSDVIETVLRHHPNQSPLVKAPPIVYAKPFTEEAVASGYVQQVVESAVHPVAPLDNEVAATIAATPLSRPLYMPQQSDMATRFVVDMVASAVYHVAATVLLPAKQPDASLPRPKPRERTHNAEQPEETPLIADTPVKHQPAVKLAAVKPPPVRKKKKAPPPTTLAGQSMRRSPPKHEQQAEFTEAIDDRASSPAPRLRKLEEYMAQHPVDRVRKAYQRRRHPEPALAPETHTSGYDAEDEDNRPLTVSHAGVAPRSQVLAPLNGRRPPDLPAKIKPTPVVDRPDKLGLVNKPKKRSGFCQQCIYEGRPCKIVDCLKHQKLR